MNVSFIFGLSGSRNRQGATLTSMSRTGPESGRADALRNRTAILDAAVDVLADDSSASLVEVARRAGLGRATLYRHFPSRDDLRAAIRQEALSRAGAALEAARLDECSVREGVRNAAAALVPLGMRFRILLDEGADADPEFLAARDRTLRPLGELVQRGIAEGELCPHAEPAWVLMALAGLLTTAVRAAISGIVPGEEAGALVSDALFDGFGPTRR